MDNGSRKPRVLLAEDDEATRDMVRQILEHNGFDVVACSDGASAFKAAQEMEFDAAVVDVTMPVMNGFELVRRLRGLPEFERMPIVMLTGAGSADDIVHGFDLGVSDYVTKPFNLREFVARLWRLVQRPG